MWHRVDYLWMCFTESGSWRWFILKVNTLWKRFQEFRDEEYEFVDSRFVEGFRLDFVDVFIDEIGHYEPRILEVRIDFPLGSDRLSAEQIEELIGLLIEAHEAMEKQRKAA